MSLFRYVALFKLACRSFVMSLYRYIALSLCRSFEVCLSLFCYIALLKFACRSFVMSLYRYVALSLYRSFEVCLSLFCYVALLKFACRPFVMSLCRYVALLLCRSFKLIPCKIWENKNVSRLTRIIKAMVFLVGLYGRETWTKTKAMKKNIYACEMWIWRSRMRVASTDRRMNESDSLQEIGEIRGGLSLLHEDDVFRARDEGVLSGEGDDVGGWRGAGEDGREEGGW